MPYCTNCGKANPDDARFCSQCGTRLVSEPVPPAVAGDSTATINIARSPPNAPRSPRTDS